MTNFEIPAFVHIGQMNDSIHHYIIVKLSRNCSTAEQYTLKAVKKIGIISRYLRKIIFQSAKRSILGDFRYSFSVPTLFFQKLLANIFAYMLKLMLGQDAA